MTNISETRSDSHTSTHSLPGQKGGIDSVSMTNHHSSIEHLTGIIMDTFPKTARGRAVSLLRYLVRFGRGVFEVDGSGTLHLYGRKMESGITDYLYSALLNDRFQHHRPEDFNRFLVALDQIHVPAYLLQKQSDKNSVSETKVRKKSKWIPY